MCLSHEYGLCQHAPGTHPDPECLMLSNAGKTILGGLGLAHMVLAFEAEHMALRSPLSPKSVAALGRSGLAPRVHSCPMPYPLHKCVWISTVDL